jgi:hypothetical protein
VTARLYAEIGGTPVPLDQCDWVLWASCGCPKGVTVAAYAATEDDAWRAFYDYKRDIAKAQRQGMRLELMTHARYSAEVCDRMFIACPHGCEPS